MRVIVFENGDSVWSFANTNGAMSGYSRIGLDKEQVIMTLEEALSQARSEFSHERESEKQGHQL